MTGAVGSARSPGLARRWGPWAAMAAIVVTALLVGTVSRHDVSTNADRLTAIARSVKCPVCAGESVAESNAQISQEIRKYIGQQLAVGRTDDQIRESLREQYGDYILLTPAATGVTSVVWILPVVMLVVAIAGLAWAFSRWRVRGDARATDADRALVATALAQERVSSDEADPEMGGGR